MVGLSLMSNSRLDKRKAKNKKKLIIASVALTTIIVAIFIAINLSNDSSSNINSSDEIVINEIKKFDDDNFSSVLINPNENKGANVNITGEVLDSKREGKLWRIKIYQKPEDDDGLIVIESKVDSSAEKGDIVKVIGVVKGVETIETSGNGSIKVPVIKAGSVTNKSKAEIRDSSDSLEFQDHGMR